MTKQTPSNICPRCGGGIPNDVSLGEYPGALSRWDNNTEICSECGVMEAMLDWGAGSYRAGGEHLAPNHPERPWKIYPA
jgi:hypothetical protein